MEFRKINNCGKLGFDFSIGAGGGRIVAKDFSKNLIENIIKRSTKYFDETDKIEHIFSFGDKQFHSVVCPSIADLTYSYVIEHPTTREPHREDNYSGHIDYWINYRNYSILIELKHSRFAYKRSNPNRDISNKFKKSLKQLKDIKRNECHFLTINKGLIKIALQTIVFYQQSQNRISYKDLKDQDFEDDFDRLILNSDLKKSNFRSLWLLHERLIKSAKLGDNYFKIFPAVAFIGKITNVLK